MTRLPSLAFLKASLKLWRRRHAYRQQRLNAAHKANSPSRVEKWHRLLAAAGVKIRLRERQIDARANHPGVRAQGIDVSNNQGHVDFAKVRKAGYRFVIIKATEGVGYIDPFFHDNVRAAKAAGLKVGAYHFLRPQPGRAGRDEADEFFAQLRKAGLGRGDLLPVVDVEVTKLGPLQTRNYVGSFIAQIARLTGSKPLLYTYPAFMTWRETFGCKLWIAHYGVAAPQVPLPWTGYTIWQHSSTASVPGVRGNCDVNVCPSLGRVMA